MPNECRITFRSKPPDIMAKPHNIGIGIADYVAMQSNKRIKQKQLKSRLLFKLTSRHLLITDSSPCQFYLSGTHIYHSAENLSVFIRA